MHCCHSDHSESHSTASPARLAALSLPHEAEYVSHDTTQHGVSSYNSRHLHGCCCVCITLTDSCQGVSASKRSPGACLLHLCSTTTPLGLSGNTTAHLWRACTPTSPSSVFFAVLPPPCAPRTAHRLRISRVTASRSIYRAVPRPHPTSCTIAPHAGLARSLLLISLIRCTPRTSSGR